MESFEEWKNKHALGIIEEVLTISRRSYYIKLIGWSYLDEAENKENDDQMQWENSPPVREFQDGI